MKNIIKILTALATIAGAVYIIATYGEQIVAWAKKLLDAMPKCPCCDKDEDEAEVIIEVTEEPVAAEDAAEPVAEVAADAEEIIEEPAPEIVVAENEPVAEEADFAE